MILTKPVKYIALALLFIMFALVFVFMYRLFFMFNSDKVKGYATEAANGTGDPNKAFLLIIESCEFIKKSTDLSKQVKLLSEIDSIDKEKALVLTALNQCYANGFIARPMGVTIPNPDDNI